MSPLSPGGDQHPRLPPTTPRSSPRSTPQGTQADYLVYQAPDDLGGYIQSGNKRTYVDVIGTNEYQSMTGDGHHGPANHLTFYEQPSQGRPPGRPGPQLPPLTTARARTSNSPGRTYTFTLTQGGQIGTVHLHRVGNYVSIFAARLRP